LSLLKELFVPGSLSFLLFALTLGTALLYRRRDGGRAGRRVILAVVVLYWVWSTPVLARLFLDLLTPDYPPVQSPAQAGGAGAIVVLGAGLDVLHSRGDTIDVSPREDTLRVLEAARVYLVLEKPWVVVTGGYDHRSEAAHMAEELGRMGVPPERLVLEPQAQNTREHAIYVPPLLRERHVARFVLVTSRQHMSRALRVFRKAGWDPIPSTPEAYADDREAVNRWLPSRNALLTSEQVLYGEAALAYYWIRGWI
jgi:uncharacterized SAM-binding protein YcdF (DUF218 family)